MVWRISPAHKKLQLRMEQMRKFRRQHEQLRTVIVRVLRPTVVKTTTLADGDPAELKPEMDAADLSAIEEVPLFLKSNITKIFRNLYISLLFKNSILRIFFFFV